MDGQTQAHPTDHLLAELATGQHGVITRQQLLALGLGRGAIDGRVQSGRLHCIHRGVYALGHKQLSQRGHWLAAVLACGDSALLSHRSAAGLWGLMPSRASPVDVTAKPGRRGRAGIISHEGRVHAGERATRDGIPVTSVPRTLFDLAEVTDEAHLRRTFEEADRLNLLRMAALERICERGRGRRALRPIRRLMAQARTGATRSSLEDRFVAFCREHRLPAPVINAPLLGFEVDALWPRERLVVELDGFAFHHHRAAFERDRARDAILQAAGYRVIRLTHRRLVQEGSAVAEELRRLLG
jgi:very-short-patch-repair endonuclease